MDCDGGVGSRSSSSGGGSGGGSGSSDTRNHTQDDTRNGAAFDDDTELQVQASSRLLSGGDTSHAMLEGALASSKSYESALVYPTGYMTNTGVIPVLAGSGDVVFSDDLNHASIIDGCRLARGAKTVTYGHNDADDLESKMAEGGGDLDGHMVVVTEGVFSMDGDVAPLVAIRDVAEKYDAILVVDDAHGDFVMGRNGRGTPDHLGLADPRCGAHVYISSLSKGLGSFGGYVASDHSVIDLCVNRSRPFIYTSALPSYFAKHAYRRIVSVREQDARRAKLAQNVRLLSEALEGAGYPTESRTHIMPVMVGSELRATELARHLYRCGVYAPAIRYPTVPLGEARLRISATAWLEGDDISAVRRALESAPS